MVAAVLLVPLRLLTARIPAAASSTRPSMPPAPMPASPQSRPVSAAGTGWAPDDGDLRGGAARLRHLAGVGVAQVETGGFRDIAGIGVAQVLLGEGRGRREGGEDEAECGDDGDSMKAHSSFRWRPPGAVVRRSLSAHAVNAGDAGR